MSFSEFDRGLFEFLKGIMHSAVTSHNRTNYTKQAELLWVGKHYLMTRSGPYEGVREVEIWSREALILKRRNPYDNDMYAIALAALDPIHKRWDQNFRRVIWRSNGGGAAEEFKRKKWSAKTKAGLIDWVKENWEATFEERLAAFQDQFDNVNKFSQAMAGLFNDTRRRTMGTTEIDGVPYPAGYMFNVQFHNCPFSDSKFRFKPKKNGETVQVIWKNVELSREEFEILAKAVLKIAKLREELPPVERKTPGKKMRRKTA